MVRMRTKRYGIIDVATETSPLKKEYYVDRIQTNKKWAVNAKSVWKLEMQKFIINTVVASITRISISRLFSAAKSHFSSSQDLIYFPIISFVPLKFFSFVSFIAIGCKNITPVDEFFSKLIDTLKYRLLLIRSL